MPSIIPLNKDGKPITTTTAAAAAPDHNSTSTTTAGGAHATLETLHFSNTFTTELPADPSTENRPRQVHNAFFSYVNPSGTGTEPTTIITSKEVSTLIGLDPSETERPEFALVFSGNALLPGDTQPYAQCYGGHQFGNWAGQLGDGRAICLGEVLNKNTGIRWELQLKGAGRTPYSRFADGRAVLRSSIREYVASEAMAALGVPTTRALSLVATGDEVMRDMFYNGNAQMEPGAVVCRVARSFIRFGTFQLPVSRGDDQVPMAKQLADYVIRHFYPECSPRANAESAQFTGENQYSDFLKAVATRTGRLVAEWQRVGFVHGVLNTDNMSILGDTIDYGPYGWLERFDPEFTPNTTDLPGRRYCFQAQPEIGQWNILQLARSMALGGLMSEDEAREGIEAYGDSLVKHYSAMMTAKMGLKEYERGLTNALLSEMYTDSADYTNTFRALTSVKIHGDQEESQERDDGAVPAELAAAVGLEELGEERRLAWSAWVRQYRAALRAAGWKSEEERRSVQDKANPAIVPRNHVLVGIIGEAENGQYDVLERYMAALKNPYELRKGEYDEKWLEPGPKQSRMGVELLSCSS